MLFSAAAAALIRLDQGREISKFYEATLPPPPPPLLPLIATASITKVLIRNEFLVIYVLKTRRRRRRILPFPAFPSSSSAVVGLQCIVGELIKVLLLPQFSLRGPPLFRSWY